MNIVIAGGGTGGHLFPGIALAREFVRVNRKNRVLFIGTRKGIESTVIPKEGFRIRYILASGFKNRPFFKKIVSLIQIPLSVIQSFSFLAGFRADIVVGVGGYASGAVGVSSFLLNVPLVIQEQNVKPGVTNRFLGRLAREIFSSFVGTGRYVEGKNVHLTGNPIRREVVEAGEVKPNRKGTRFSILVLGGSQGARSLNIAIVNAMKYLPSMKESLSVVLQTGRREYETVQGLVEGLGFDVSVLPFIDDMGCAYKNADLVISRSGATTLAEITASGKPAILVPFPFAVENHQECNARELEKRGCAKVILDGDFSGERLAEEITYFFNNRETLQRMGIKSKEAGRPEAATLVVSRCLKIVEQAGV